MADFFFVLFFFTAAAMLYKAASQSGANQVGMIAVERTAVVVFTASFILLMDSLTLSPGLTGLAAAGGAAIFFSRWALLLALTTGKISSSWAVVNLSVAIPTMASILIWKEVPDAKTFIGLALVPAAIMLLRERRYVE